MATIDLGRLGFVNKGTYNNNTTYEKNDLVQFTDGGVLSTYLYIDSSAQSGQAPSSSGTAGSRWVYYAKGGPAGADGTDVAAVLNNNEIAFKTNAGALDGLPIGTAGQALKVNSGANGYEFGSAGTSELLGSGESSNVTSQVINNSVLTSAYEEFIIYMFMSKASGGGGGQREMFVSTSNGSSTDPLDRVYHFAQIYPGGGTGHGLSAAGINQDRMHLNVGATDGDFHNSKITILRPSFASAGERNRNTILSEAVSSQNPGSSVNVENLTSWACIHDGNGNRMSNIDYVRFEMNGAGFDIKWAVYGRKW